MKRFNILALVFALIFLLSTVWGQTTKKTVAELEQGCSSGNPKDCNTLGIMFNKGESVAQDKGKAAQLFQKACDGSDAPGCTNLGFLYDNGQGVAQDKGKAAQLYQKACDGGDSWGCNNLGVLYANGQGVEQDKGKATQLFQKACDNGNALGCKNLGFLYDNGQGVAQDKGKAAQLYQKACDSGEAWGCNNLGLLYNNGQGVAKDTAKAAQLFQKACDGGIPKSCLSLGLAYNQGAGVVQDAVKAAQLFQKACDGDELTACTNLGFMYGAGRGVTRDDAKAVQLYQKACNGGFGGGCHNLGRLYYQGKGVPLDKSKAALLFKKACDYQDEGSCEQLRLQKACDGGDAGACNILGGTFQNIDEGKKEPANIQKIIARQATVPDVGETLEQFGRTYYLENDTIVFWSRITRQLTTSKSKYTFPIWGLFSWKDGSIKTIFLEGGKEKLLYGADDQYDVHIKQGKDILYIDVRNRFVSKVPNSVYCWDGSLLKKILSENDEITVSGTSQKIKYVDTLSVNPDGSAILSYVSKKGGLLLFKDDKLAPLYQDGDRIPGINGKVSFDWMHNIQAMEERHIDRAQGAPDLFVENADKIGDYDPFLGMDDYRKQSGAPQDRRPIVFQECMLVQIETNEISSILARIGKDKTEKILSAGDVDPTDSTKIIDKIDGFNASSPEIIIMKIKVKKGNTKLILYEKGKFKLIHEFHPGKGSSDIEQEFLLGNTLFLKPDSNRFCFFMKTLGEYTWIGLNEKTRLVKYTIHYYDGEKLCDLTGDAVFDRGSSVRLVPDGSGRLIVYLIRPKTPWSQFIRYYFDGNSNVPQLLLVKEPIPSNNMRPTFADIIGVNLKEKKIYFELADGFYVMNQLEF
jgi:hypothetical protein